MIRQATHGSCGVCGRPGLCDEAYIMGDRSRICLRCAGEWKRERPWIPAGSTRVHYRGAVYGLLEFRNRKILQATAEAAPAGAGLARTGRRIEPWRGIGR